MRFSELCDKEVICCSNGARLGFVEDLQIDQCTGEIQAIIIPVSGRFLGVFGAAEEVVVSWSDIDKMGEDIILVNSRAEACLKRNKKKC